MANFKRYDPNIVKEMVTYAKRMRKVKRKQPLTFERLFYMLVSRFRATARELCAALYYDWLHGLEPSTDWMKNYQQFKRQFNSDERHPDDEVIAIRQSVVRNGKKGKIWINVLASGDDAGQAAKDNEAPRDGYNEKIDRLIVISQDKNLRRRQLKRLRELEAGKEEN